MTSLKTNVGQVVIKLIDEHKPEDYQYVADFQRFTITGWKPQSREGQLCIVYKDNLYLFGGHNSDPIGDVCMYNIKQSTWSKVPDSQIKRSYHTGVVYKEHYFVIFGGMSKYNAYYKTRECLNSLCLFSPLVHGVKQIKIQNQQIVEPRRSHGACIIGKQMLILGGINMYRQYLKDFKYLDFRELKWVQIDYKVETPQLEEFLDHGIAKHVMIANFKHRPGHHKLHHKDYEQGEGVYIFGGTNQVGIRSIVLHICFKKRVPKFHKLFPSGYLPSAISPIVSKVNDNIIAVISGQRSEREMKLYKIKQNEFVSVHYHKAQLGGIGSSMVNYKDQMYILFGVGEKGYIGNISSFKLQQKLKTQLEKEVRRQRRHSTVNKEFRMPPNFFNISDHA